jgi:hypothetical protein
LPGNAAGETVDLNQSASPAGDGPCAKLQKKTVAQRPCGFNSDGRKNVSV